MRSGPRSSPQLSLRARNTAWFVVLLAGALLAFSIAIHVGIKSFLVGSLQRSLTRVVETVIKDNLSQMPTKDDASVLTELHDTYATTRGDRFVRVTSEERKLYQTGDMNDSQVAVDDIPLPTLSIDGTLQYHAVNGEEVVVYSVLYGAPDGRRFVVEAGATLERLEQTLHFLTKLVSLVSFVILLLAAVGGYWLMDTPLKPLITLSKQAARIGHSALGERLPVVRTGDEVEQLTISLNGMIERLEASLDQNQRFSADASHELRTPLMIMHSDIEEILQREDHSAQTAANLVSTLEEIERMTRIVNSLITIARIDGGGEQMETEVFDLAALAVTTVDQMRVIAEDKGIKLACECIGQVPVSADQMHIKQVLINLIDNAIKYTASPQRSAQSSIGPSPEPFDKTVALRVFGLEGIAHLTVSDHGIGVPLEGIPFVFDRFYRTDYARSRGVGGVGLGLAIVKAIVTAHGGTVSMTSNVGVGTTVFITLPQAAMTTVPKRIIFRRKDKPKEGDSDITS